MRPNLHDPVPERYPFTTPLTPEQSITCYVADPDTIADFLKEYFEKKSITIVLDKPAGID